MIDRLLDRMARLIELVLAVAFILAVLLNFANVVGRYLFGLSLLGSDEVEVFVMVAMTFLGAVVVKFFVHLLHVRVSSMALELVPAQFLGYGFLFFTLP